MIQDVVTGELAQPRQVLERIDQAVGVVDAQAVDAVVAHPSRDLLVGRVEDGRVLDAQAGQGDDGEEAPVVLVGVGACGS